MCCYSFHMSPFPLEDLGAHSIPIIHVSLSRCLPLRVTCSSPSRQLLSWQWEQTSVMKEPSMYLWNINLIFNIIAVNVIWYRLYFICFPFSPFCYALILLILCRFMREFAVDWIWSPIFAFLISQFNIWAYMQNCHFFCLFFWLPGLTVIACEFHGFLVALAVNLTHILSLASCACNTGVGYCDLWTPSSHDFWYFLVGFRTTKNSSLMTYLKSLPWNVFPFYDSLWQSEFFWIYFYCLF